jgi:hypothetical protein
MSEPQKAASWWQTVPGVLTALAAVLTAASGLAALLFQHGVLGEKMTEPTARVQPAPQVAPSSGAADPRPSTSVARPAAAAATRSWPDAQAAVLAKDGSTTRVRADSFSHCISVNHEIAFDAGQSIPFERMAGFEVLQADDHGSPNAKAKLRVELLDGTAVAGTVDAACDLFGTNSLGRFTTYFDRVRSVRFE